MNSERPGADPRAVGSAPASAGLHHVTAIASDPQRNVDFHAGVLGLRLVKRTVNFDDPGTYHLYFGDAAGSPGALVTFFPWPGATRGRAGGGETSATAYRIPEGSSVWWRARLGGAGVAVRDEPPRFGGPVLAFEDRDGMRFELVEGTGEDGVEPWTGSGVPREHAIRGFHSVTLATLRAEKTARVLVDLMGFEDAGAEGLRRRFVATGGADAAAPAERARAGRLGAIVDLIETAGPRGELGAGSVHHVAFRARDEAEQGAFGRALADGGLRVTDVADRCYFRSIYFREPGGVLFEIATDPPGMALDEPRERLGERLQLPPWYEGLRPRLEAALPALRVPAAAGAGA